MNSGEIDSVFKMIKHGKYFQTKYDLIGNFGIHSPSSILKRVILACLCPETNINETSIKQQHRYVVCMILLNKGPQELTFYISFHI